MSKSKDESLRSYNYVCQKFGSKEMVRLRRHIYNIWDIINTEMDFIGSETDIRRSKTDFLISSGSAVEGLDMIGSDVDLMLLFNYIVVCTSEHDAENVAEINHVTTLIMDTDNTNPCYVLLRVPKNVPFKGFYFSKNISVPGFNLHTKGRDEYISSHQFKLDHLNMISRFGLRRFFLIPDELEIEVTNNVPFFVDSIIMTHFLKFLSNYHLGDFMSCIESLVSLEGNAETWYRLNIVGKRQITSAFLCLGVAHEMMGHLNKAHECFSTCVAQGKWNVTKADFRLSKLYA
ncbi:unnamed protein product [Mytilus edulis]|uniref:Uncharacterized protein n=1 Tax=Mytilus edulis TaxID=6550 RepID=A0A8S3SKB9_MYTED|nr:unnamed protein product [Mytilus edulis]